MSTYDIAEYPHPSRRAILFTVNDSVAYNFGRIQYDEGILSGLHANSIFGTASTGTNIKGIDASPRGDLLAVFVAGSSSIGRLEVYDGYKNRLLSISLPAGGYDYDRNPIAFAPRGRLIALSGYQFVSVVDVVTGDIVFSTGDYCCAVAWSPDQSLLATGSKFGAVRVYETTGWTSVASRLISAASAEVSGLVWAMDGSSLYASVDSTGNSSNSFWNMAAYDVAPGAWRPQDFFNASVSNNVGGICGLACNDDCSELYQFRRNGSSYYRISTTTGGLVAIVPISRAVRSTKENVAKMHAGGIISVDSNSTGQFPFIWLQNSAAGTIELAERQLFSGIPTSAPVAGPALFYGLAEISNKNGVPVTDANNNPAKGMKVVALSRSNFAPVSNVSTVDASGRYTLALGASDPVTVLFSSPSDNYNSQVLDWVVPK